MDKIIKIGIATPFSKSIGGVEIFNKQLSEILIDSGFRVEILSIDDEVETLEVKKSIVYKILGYDYIWRKKYKQDLHKYDLIICNGEYGFMIKHKNAIQVYHGSAFGYYINISNNLNFVSKLKLLIK